MLFRAIKIFSAIFAAIALAVPGLMIFQSFLDAPIYQASSARVTLSNYVEILGSREFLKALEGSVTIALLTLLALPIALFIAIAIHKLSIPGSGLLELLIIAPIFISPLIWGFAWLSSYGPGGVLPNLWGDLYGLIPAGIISALVHVPNAYLIISSSLLNIDSSFEEVARVHGARLFTTIVKVVIPMIRPSIAFSAILLLIFGIEQFGIPLLFYTSIGGQVLTTYLYSLQVQSVAPSYPREAVVASVTIYMAVSLILLQRYTTTRTLRRYEAITGRARGVSKARLGSIQSAAVLGLLLAYALFTVVIPLGALVYRSLSPIYGGGGGLTLDYYLEIFSSSYHRQILANTLEASVLAASAGAVACLGYAIGILRSGSSLESRLYDIASTIPRSMPGIVIGLAFLWLYLFTPLRPLMYSVAGLAIAYAVSWSIVGVRIIASNLAQISPELEEVARAHGANRSGVLARILLPLLRKAILVTWLVVFIYSLRDYTISTMLVQSQTTVVGSFLVMAYGSGELGLVAAFSSITVFITLALSLSIFRLGWKPYG